MLKTTHWDVADHLETPEDMAAYLEAALEDGYPPLIAAVLDDIARAQGQNSAPGQAVLSADLQLNWHELMRVIELLNLRLSVTALSEAR